MLRKVAIIYSLIVMFHDFFFHGKYECTVSVRIKVVGFDVSPGLLLYHWSQVLLFVWVLEMFGKERKIICWIQCSTVCSSDVIFVFAWAGNPDRRVSAY